MEGDEVFDASSLGQAETVEQERISDDELIIITGTKVKFNPGLLLIIEFRNKAVALLLCEERTTSCATRSNDPFTMLFASSSVCSSLNLSSAVVEPSRLPCPSSLRTTLIGLLFLKSLK